jgi:hypothetical protein
MIGRVEIADAVALCCGPRGDCATAAAFFACNQT